MNKAIQSNSIWKASEIRPKLFEQYPYINSTKKKAKFMVKKIKIFLD